MFVLKWPDDLCTVTDQVIVLLLYRSSCVNPLYILLIVFIYKCIVITVCIYVSFDVCKVLI